MNLNESTINEWTNVWQQVSFAERNTCMPKACHQITSTLSKVTEEKSTNPTRMPFQRSDKSSFPCPNWTKICCTLSFKVPPFYKLYNLGQVTELLWTSVPLSIKFWRIISAPWVAIKIKWENSRKVSTTLPGLYHKLKDAGYIFRPDHNTMININSIMVPCCYNVIPTCFHSLSWYLPCLPVSEFLMFTGRMQQGSSPIGMKGHRIMYQESSMNAS